MEESNWIKIKDFSPEKEVLEYERGKGQYIRTKDHLLWDGHFIQIGYYDFEEHIWKEENGLEITGISHVAPLPKPPKK